MKSSRLVLVLLTALALLIAHRVITYRQAASPVVTGLADKEAKTQPAKPQFVEALHNARSSDEKTLTAIRRVLPSVTSTVRDWSAFTPDTITIAPHPDLPVQFHVVRVTRENGITTWVGRNGLKGASLVGIGKKDRWDGVLSMIGGSFDIHVYGDTVRVVEHSGPFECVTPDKPAVEAGAHHEALLITPDNSVREAQSLARDVTGNAAVHTSGMTIYAVEVAFFYTEDTAQYPGVIAAAGGASQVDSFLDSKYRGYLESGNLIAEQSGIGNLRWHFAGLFKAPTYSRTFYDNGGGLNGGKPRYSISRDLSAMLEANPFGQFVRDTCASVSADEWVLIATATAPGGGIASAPGHDVAISDTSPATSLIHELGHNFGLLHDRANHNAPDSNGQYNYGYMFPYNPKNFGGAFDYNYNVGDLMSYSTMLPYFSNPNIKFRGNDLDVGSVTDTNLYALGVDVGQPKAAYGARYLSEHVAELATYRSTPGQTFPAITAQPLAASTVSVGGTVHLSTSATGTSVAYQWRKDGVAIAGATSSTYDLANASGAANGAYDVMVTNALGTIISRATSVSVSNDPVTARLANISTRSQVGTVNGVQIAGFVITGNAPKTVLIRAAGPALVEFGVQGTLNDPTLELHDATSVIAFNDDWSADSAKADEITSAGLQVGAGAWKRGSKDAALMVTLNPGAYSAIVAGKNGTTGIAIVEVFEVSQAASRVVNISTRSNVGTGDAAQIAGFVISGSGPKTVLIRASGPALAGAISGALVDPTIELHDANAVIASNDDWSSDTATGNAIRSAASQSGAFDWTTGSKDAAILVTLNPGVYSAVVTGKNGGSGYALIEVYDVP